MAAGLMQRAREVLARSLAPVRDNRGGNWWGLTIREPYTGAWQRNDEWTVDTVLAHHAVYACITLIASDIAKLRPKLVELSDDGIWSEIEHNSPFAPVLRKPNNYQNHIQFKEWWITSKLIRGNAYVLKERDDRKVVRALHLLDPSRVQVLVSDFGDVFYALGVDNLSGVTVENTVPASEIIHDRMNCLFHPLVGCSPIYASGAAANIGLNIEANTANFFGNSSSPSGILTAPGNIPQDAADKLRDQWQQKFSGTNSGRVAVIGNDIKFIPLRMSAVDSQMIEHLKWTAETVCSAFHVPAFKIGVGQQPTYANGEVREGNYYSDCLQYHIESMELALDEGLGLVDADTERLMGVELDLDGLLRMDSAAQVDTLTKGVRGGLYKPDEARKKVDLPPLPGGSGTTVYMQHQDYPIEQVYKRTDLNAPEPAPVAPTPEPEAAERDFSNVIQIRTATARMRWNDDVDKAKAA